MALHPFELAVNLAARDKTRRVRPSLFSSALSFLETFAAELVNRT